jgi:hypothetical protein
VRLSRPAALALLAPLAAVPLALAGRSVAPSRASHLAPIRSCGVERWTVKTLQDRPVLIPRKRTTVAALTSLPRPLGFAGMALALRATRLSGSRSGHARSPRGRPGLARCPEAWAKAHDRGGPILVMHEEGEALSPASDGQGTAACSHLPSRPRHWRRLLRLQTRSDRRGPERDRAPSDSRLHLRGLKHDPTDELIPSVVASALEESSDRDSRRHRAGLLHAIRSACLNRKRRQQEGSELASTARRRGEPASTAASAASATSG